MLICTYFSCIIFFLFFRVRHIFLASQKTNVTNKRNTHHPPPQKKRGVLIVGGLLEKKQYLVKELSLKECVFSPIFAMFFDPKSTTELNKKSRLFVFWCIVKDMNSNLHVFFYLIKNNCVCLFPTILTIHKWALEKPKFGKKLKILSKSTNVGFCGNFYNKSLVLMLNYTACKFYDCEEMKKVWIWKKNHFFFL